MVEFRCSDSGTFCPGVMRASSREDLKRLVAAHFSHAHRVSTPTQTIMNYLSGLATAVTEPAPGEGTR